MYEIGKRINEARKEKGMTSAKLAERVHLSLTSVYHIQCGVRLPSVETMYLIAEALGKPMDYFVREEGEEETASLQSVGKDLTPEEREQLIRIETRYCRGRTPQERMLGVIKVLMKES